MLASCTPAVATTETRTTRTAPRPACAAPTWPYSVVEVQRWWNCGHDPNIDRAGAARVKAWLDAQVAAQLGRYLLAAYLAALPTDVISIERAAAREFGVPEQTFVRVLGCESGHNPGAVNRTSGALGLGQHLPRYWGARAAALGYPYGAWSDPRANARVSAWLWATSGPQHWVCY